MTSKTVELFAPAFLKLREAGLKETFHTITDFTFYVVTSNKQFLNCF